MKQFDLKHALQTLTAKDVKGELWMLQGFALSNSRLQWSTTPNAFSCGETDLDGKVMFGECTDLYSAEVEKTTQMFYALKIAPSDSTYHFTKGGPGFLDSLVYAITLNLEDGEIVKVDFEKVRG